MTVKQYLAFDIGGTATKYGVLNEQGDILEVGKFSSRNANGFHVLEEIKKIVDSKSGIVNGLAISAPGFIDTETGYFENGGSFRDFDQFNMKSYLEKEIALPITIENDVNCVAYAEKWLGNAKEHTDFVCTTIGTGIGGALFLNGRLYRGVSNRAGEFGYMINQNKSQSILTNTLNHNATILAVRKQYASAKKIPLNKVSGETVFQAFDNGDQDAKGIITGFYDSIAKMIYHLFYIINPRKLLVGGGISSRPSFLTELKEQLSKYGIDDELLDVDTCYFKNQSGIIGATYHHIQKMESESFNNLIAEK